MRCETSWLPSGYRVLIVVAGVLLTSCMKNDAGLSGGPLGATGPRDETAIQVAVQSALARGAQLLERGGSSPGFMEALRSVRLELPCLAVVGPDDDVYWRSYELNSAGKGLDAIRFASPLDQPADLRWAIVAPPDTVKAWSILPADKGHMPDLPEPFTVEQVMPAGAAVPLKNVTHFQAVDGGRFKPRQEYIVWLSIASEEPVTVWIAARLAPAGAIKTPETATEVAEQLGMTVPLKRTTDRSPNDIYRDIARKFTQNRDREATIGSLRTLVTDADEPHRDALLMLIRLTNEHGLATIETDGFNAARPYFDETLAQAREFTRHFSDPTAHERRVVANSCYNGACMLSRAGKTDEAIEALTDAIDSGFSDQQLLKNDKDLDNIRSMDEFEALVRRVRRKARR